MIIIGTKHWSLYYIPPESEVRDICVRKIQILEVWATPQHMEHLPANQNKITLKLNQLAEN